MELVERKLLEVLVQLLRLVVLDPAHVRELAGEDLALGELLLLCGALAVALLLRIGYSGGERHAQPRVLVALHAELRTNRRDT